MTKYSTKQRNMLLSFFETHTDEAFSARGIAEALGGEGISISAIYRNLSELAESGEIHKFSKNGTREAFYQYRNAERCRGHLHLSCKKCGRTFHLDNDLTEKFSEQIAAAEQFALDKSDTVLYGICEDCQKKSDRR